MVYFLEFRPTALIYGYYGKLLCYLLAESLMMMIYDAAKKELEAKGDKSWKPRGIKP